MSNSPLVSYTCLSPNHSGKRTEPIWILTPHCVVGQCTVESLGNVFLPKSRQASSNYGVGKDGKIGLYCEEANRSWCTSSAWNDQRAITIEVASDTTAPWAFTQAAYDGLVRLSVDICKRNGKTRLLWLGSLDAVKAYESKRKDTDMVLTCHRWLAATACPGDWFYAREAQFAAEVTAQLGGPPVPMEPVKELYRVRRSWDDGVTQIGAFYELDNAKAMADKNPGYSVFDSQGQCVYPFSEYLVRISVSNLNIRSGPGTNYYSTGMIPPGIYTIVETATGQGSNGWGRLKSGAGWIALDYTIRI